MAKLDSDSTLEQLQARVRKHLDDSGLFTGATILDEDSGKIEYEIEEAIARLGLCLIVRYPIPRVSAPNVPGPYFDSVSLTVRIIENAALNTGKTAMETAEQTLRTLHHRHFTLTNNTQLYLHCDPSPITVEPSPSDEYRILDANFATKLGLIPEAR